MGGEFAEPLGGGIRMRHVLPAAVAERKLEVDTDKCGAGRREVVADGNARDLANGNANALCAAWWTVLLSLIRLSRHGDVNVGQVSVPGLRLDEPTYVASEASGVAMPDDEEPARVFRIQERRAPLLVSSGALVELPLRIP